MGRRVLNQGGSHRGGAPAGFTLIEIMVAMTISIVALLANLYLFNTAAKDLSLARALTNATNLATTKLGTARTRAIREPRCFRAGTTCPDATLEDNGFTGNGSPCPAGDVNPAYPGLLDEDFCSPASSRNAGYPLLLSGGPAAFPLCISPGVRNPDLVDRKAGPVTEVETSVVDGTTFTVTSVYADVDLQHDGSTDLVDDLLKISVEVAWTQAGKAHRVPMTTFTAGIKRECQ